MRRAGRGASARRSLSAAQTDSVIAAPELSCGYIALNNAVGGWDAAAAHTADSRLPARDQSAAYQVDDNN